LNVDAGPGQLLIRAVPPAIRVTELADLDQLRIGHLDVCRLGEGHGEEAGRAHPAGGDLTAVTGRVLELGDGADVAVDGHLVARCREVRSRLIRVELG